MGYRLIAAQELRQWLALVVAALALRLGFRRKR
jgi:hypothetical protein